MGELYQRMERDLKLKNLAESTRNEYLRCYCNFVRVPHARVVFSNRTGPG